MWLALSQFAQRKEFLLSQRVHPLSLPLQGALRSTERTIVCLVLGEGVISKAVGGDGLGGE